MTAHLIRSQSRGRVIAITTLGNVIEWFDFTVYGFMAIEIAKIFFPESTPAIGLLAAFASFGVGFGARPFGAIVFGRLGDRRGRRFVMVTSISIMGLASFLIGGAPTYAQAGTWGVAILILGRLLQGISAGADFGSAIAYLVESAPPHRRGLYGSFHQIGSAVGLLVGAVTSASLTTLLDLQQMAAFGWRIPFLLAGSLALVGLALRLTLQESPAFLTGENDLSGAPEDRPIGYRIMLTVGIGALWAVAPFAAIVFMPTFAAQFGAFPAGYALWASVAAILATVGTIPLSGYLSDRFGARACLIVSAVAFALSALPGYWLVANTTYPGVAIAIMVFFGVLTGIVCGAGPLAVSELFEVRTRSTWISIAPSLASAAFGGFAPFFSTYLIRSTGWSASPGLYVIFAALLTGASAVALPRSVARHRRHAHTVGGSAPAKFSTAHDTIGIADA